MFQTWWDLNQQNIRKVVDTAMGVLGGYALAYGEWGAIGVALLGLAVNYVWFWFSNRNKVTVAGLEKANKTGAAVAVEKALDALPKFR